MLAGEGLGGLVAFDLALRAPESFAGVLLVDATIDDVLTGGRAADLGRLELTAALVGAPDARVEGLLHGASSGAHVETLAERLEAARVDVRHRDARATADRRVEALTAAARALLLSRD